MNPTPSYTLVFFDAKQKPMWKKVEQTQFASLAQDEIIKEIELAGIPHIITSRKSFNMSYTHEITYFLIMDIIIKPL
jgi:hypothetical protein